MTPTPKRFAWHDRDTAARDLLQLATYAPPSIRIRALRLLRNIRSPAILPELEQIVLDESADIWERHYALCAIASMPGDLYLPHFAAFSDPEHGLFNAVVTLANHHPTNLQWLFHEIDRLPYQFTMKMLLRLIEGCDPDSTLNLTLFQRILNMVEKYPRLLTMNVIGRLYTYGNTDAIQHWFSTQTKTLIYVYLVSNPQSPDLLDQWEELREAVFRNCASVREEYMQRKQSEDAENSYGSTPRNYQLSELWQSVCLLYHSALQESSFDSSVNFNRLVGLALYGQDNMARRAIATHFLRKLKHKYDVQTPLIQALREISDDIRYRYADLHTAARFEAGYALCEMPSPAVWEAMIDIFLTLPENSFEDHLPKWIAYLTDYLSGVDTRHPSTTKKWRSEEQRMLRYTFDDMHPENQELLSQRPER